jgi:hypothetical protein
VVFGARWNLCVFDRLLYGNSKRLGMCVGLYRSEIGIWTKERKVEEGGKQLVHNEGIDKM